ncbi:hypothetical protein [Phaeobacter gallaeciensis]|uniref:hypothetical protein n=1 Tax=Phaeobacter gallaeciensis TaxID=60890 RepID=UPI000BBC53D8|nr:hypothetical protein [Phaeobacter gallaeciensis]ATF18575.1 3-oxoacyl-[acyl-carrier-protein] synthase III [Phaeobacter gallaeciensis]ATF22684.1 3-oxoacyl-[acyl-carrier-protein] synthase III [Phaeobacter gallaeciensis]
MRLTALTTHIPEERIAAEQIIRDAGGSPSEARVFERLFGLGQVSSCAKSETRYDQFARIIEDLQAQSGDIPRPDTLIHVRGLPMRDCAPGAVAPRLRRDFAFLSHVRQKFDLDQTNCAGLIWALELARTLMKAGQARVVAVLAGDGHDRLRLADRYVPGSTLMGDAFCGLILVPDADAPADTGLRVGRISLTCHPRFAFGYKGSSAQMGSFFAAHGQIVSRTLRDLGFDWTSGSPLLPHNVNRLAWQSFCTETGLATDRIRLGLLPDIGHCYTVDPFLLLKQELSDPDSNLNRDPGTPATLLSVGMGGYAAGCQMRRTVPSSLSTCSQRSSSHALSA